jgi:restriction system protein
VRSIQKRIVLIDGAEVVKLMIEHDIGVSSDATIEIKRLDNDYFDEG